MTGMQCVTLSVCLCVCLTTNSFTVKQSSSCPCLWTMVCHCETVN